MSSYRECCSLALCLKLLYIKKKSKNLMLDVCALPSGNFKLISIWDNNNTMQRLFVFIRKSSTRQNCVRSGSALGSSFHNARKVAKSNTSIFIREYSKIAVNDLRVGMVLDTKGKMDIFFKID